MDLPTDIVELCQIFWAPPQSDAVADPFESVIVTAFFDIGRSGWRLTDGAPSPLRHTVDDYFTFFGWLAKLKNPFVIFTEPGFAPRILELRRSCGLEGRTTVISVDRLFEHPQIAAVAAAAGERMNRRFQRWVLHPEFPEFSQPMYVTMVGLKAAFANTAIRLGVVKAPQLAWIDFGYCRDDQRFDPTRPWRFDAKDRINLFNITQLNPPPTIARVVRRAAVFFQGGAIVGPIGAWPALAVEFSRALDALLACDLVDDDQTLILMAWRRDPTRYRLHGVLADDWRIVFRRFNCDVPLEDVQPRAAPKEREEPQLVEELRFVAKRWEWRWKRLRRAVGFA